MKHPFSIKQRIKSFGYARKGIRSFISKEHNAWIHCAAIIVVTCAGFYFNISKGEWVSILLCFALVLASEAFNTAIERLVDLVSPDKHPIAGDVKDIAAGAVLICAIVSAIIGAIIFIPYVIEYII
ncbi:diacylglycerol kinase family protein [Bacteroides sp. 224]|uniref:diacylglycerol kinase family protein n=1 Tax=Bacteroides sp. 224 TaxID=2302936 RepID=UPI0013D1F7D5|nr:diacylglycerol kinase family protein [Bacteroides sp. 224]NDV64534.1 diacylglycerol kinase family protein [Bacteroides sp. 224]